MRLVVGYVPDRRGQEAVNLASTLAGARDIHLDVVVVLPSDDPTFDMYSPDRAFNAAMGERGRRWLADAMSHVADGVNASGEIRHAETITAGLIEAATDPSADSPAEAIVVGASSRGMFGQLKIGSVASALLHSAPVPVALAPAGYEPHPALTRITCAIGERSGAAAVLEVAAHAASARGIPLRVMSLVALDDQAAGSHEARIDTAERHKDDLVEHARTLMPAGVEVTGVVGTGRSLVECVKSLEFEPSEIVLLGSSRLAAHRRVFLSPAAQHISRALPVPMVVVPLDYQP